MNELIFYILQYVIEFQLQVHRCDCTFMSSAVVFLLQLPHLLPAVCPAPATVATMAKSRTGVHLAALLTVPPGTLLLCNAVSV